MNLNLYLPIAGISASIYLLFGLGILVGFLSGLFGVGGGFLLTPLLIMIGVPPTVAAATDSNQIVAASTSGTYAHWRLGNVDFKMGAFLLIGGVVGGSLGVQLIKLLRMMGDADFTIKIIYVLMLGIIGSYMFYESLTKLRASRRPDRPIALAKESWFGRLDRHLPFRTEFPKSAVSMSMLMPLFLGTLVGILSALMGVGGGFIMVPVMVYMLRMPMHVVIGTSLFQILFTCINVTFMQSYFNHTVDFTLAVILLIGSTIGSQIGVRISSRLKADQLKIILASLVLIVMGIMLFGLLKHPSLLLSMGEVH
ncbi:MAG TPA: sulfite exporter TauE/SafE family protein [Bacteroidetes bacterium]|nr:hypothetical protein BMS3Bbin04_00341 [bacterium BMS3Bbin04]HDO64838.1 sulfite exporter TauE/SafE family protein [Bacteroidota bacterium]HEX03963.1 sulfite exporter TauE/SafE family protein [Bacteroidota bacterium]